MRTHATELIFILDRSGSMTGMQREVVSGFNEMVSRQKELGDTRVTAVLFNQETRPLWESLPAEECLLTQTDFRPAGTTALLDAVGHTLSHTQARIDDLPEKPQAVVMVIVTDGLENASREYTHPQVQALIRDRQAAGWEFVFLAANLDARAEADRLGICEQDAYHYKATRVGTRQMYRAMDQVITDKRKRT